MPRPIPQYIQEAPIFDSKIGYKWDDMAIAQYFDYDDPDISERLDKVCDRANIAFTIAVGEWVVHRFDEISADRTPHRYFEALWAASVDWRYITGDTFHEDKWGGAVRRPLAIAMLIGGEAIDAALSQTSVSYEVAYMTNLAKHVLPDYTAFKQWHEKVIQRLERLFPSAYDPDDLFREGNELGPPVPREVFDTNTDYDPADGDLLTKNFLRGISPDRNEFLFSANEMKKNGFEGAPYQ
jgi:hypothetical protein